MSGWLVGWVLAAVVLLAGGLVVAQAPEGPGAEVAQDLKVAYRPLSPSPLSARVSPASAWTGRELLIWGGMGGRPGYAMTTDDGAAYDPATDAWRMLPPAPLPPRAGPSAVWTGSEMIVWGGRGGWSASTWLSDGAAYDPATDSWRTIPAAPPEAAQGYAQAVWVADRMVVGGGETPAQGTEAAEVAVFDPGAGAWTVYPLPAPVVAVAAAGSQAALLLDDVQPTGQREVLLAWLDPVSGAVSAVAPLPQPGGQESPRRHPDGLGLVWTGERLLVTVSPFPGGQGTQAILSYAPDILFPESSTLVDGDDLELHPEISLGYPGLGGGQVWTGDRLLGASGRSVYTFEPSGGHLARWPGELQGLIELNCGVGGQVWAWTGEALLAWGGQTCEAEGPRRHDTGYLLTLGS